MSSQGNTPVYTQGFGTKNLDGITIANVPPTASDTNYPLGHRWIYQTSSTTANIYELTNLSSSSGVTSSTWTFLESASGALNTLSGDSGTATSSSNNIQIAGTSNEISTVGSGSTITLSLPSTLVAPGSITATTTVTATSGAITATNGNFVATASGTGLKTSPAIGMTGNSPITANGRVVSATFTDVSIAAGATQSLVIGNSSITSNSQIGLVSWSGATSGSALTLQSVVNSGSANTSTFTFTNGSGATTSTANITITYFLLN